MMRHRSLLILLSCLVAGGLLAVTVLLGPSLEPEPEEVASAPRPAGELPAADPSEMAQGFEPGQGIGEEMGRSQFVRDIRQGHYRFMDEQERPWLLSFERFRPLGQEGQYEVIGPVARVYFAVDRVMLIEADACTLSAPENLLRGGEFRGDVELTVFETPDGTPVDLDRADHIRFQAELDDVNFDMVLGELESDRAVRIVGPGVEFRGEGLTLTYNELRKRIEFLRIERGESVRFQPDLAAQPEEQFEVSEEAAEPVEEDVETAPTGPATVEKEAEPANEAEEADERTFYRARFRDNVTVESVTDEVWLGSDRLEAVFSFSADDVGEMFTAAGSASGGTARHPGAPTAGALAQADGGAGQPIVPGEEELAEGAAPGREVLIRWTGPLMVEPITDPPAEVAADPSDVMLSVFGSPARIVAPNRTQAEAGRIDYLMSGTHLHVAGQEGEPFRLTSAVFGALVGRSLTINEEAGTGHIEGPGRLAVATDAMESEAEPVLEGVDEMAERDLRITWRDRLDLDFYRNETGKGEGGPFAGLAGLREARFAGAVEVEHPQFALDAQTLRLALDRPSGPGEQAAVREVEASDEVRLVSRDLPEEEAFALETDVLGLELDTEGEEVRPSGFTARGGVSVQQTGLLLRSEELEADLSDPASGAAEATLGAERSGFALDRLEAREQVEVDLEQEQVRLAGGRLLVDPATGELELFGGEDEPAQIVRPDATLTGPRIRLSRHDQGVAVDGAGWLDVALDPESPRSRLVVNWDERLSFRDREGRILLAGNVEARAEAQSSRIDLTSQELELWMADRPEGEAEPASEAGEGLDGFGGRALERGIARGEAKFAAVVTNEATGEQDARLRLEGPSIAFDGEREQVVVEGEGWMGIENFRETSEEAGGAGALGGEVAFTGQGRTVFTWTGSLTLDAGQNDMVIREGVVMRHQPVGDQPVMQLDSQFLLADLVETGGIAGWQAEDAPQPEIRLIRADERVRVLQGNREVHTDHLQYTAEDQVVLLWAESGNLVRVRSAEHPAGMSARELHWDLQNGRFDARETGPSVVPIREGVME